MFKNSVLITIFIYPSIRCQDVCPQIAENGIYRGLRIYHRMVGLNISGHTYVMFNRYGKEWEFAIKLTDSGFRIEIKKNSMKSYESPYIVNRFSTFNEYLKKWWDCEITSEPRTPQILNCWNEKGAKEWIYIRQLYSNAVILMVKNPNRKHSMIMFRKTDRYQDYKPYIIEGPHRGLIKSCSGGPQDCKYEPPFVSQMDSSLFNRIEGVVDYRPESLFNRHRYLLLFNINGRPMICLTEKGGQLSEGCKTSDNMQPIFEECFTGGLPPPTGSTTSMAITVDPTYTKVWIIVGIVILFVIVIVVILVLYFCCRKKKKRRHSNHFMHAFETVTHETPHTLSSGVAFVISQMDSTLFKSIEGIIDYKFESLKMSGHLLLFNISGVPKICFTEENENISEQCQSSDKMTPLFTECFNTGPPLPTDSSTTDSPTNTSEPKNTLWFWIIVGIVSLFVVVVVVILVFHFCCRKKKKRRHPNHFMHNWETVSHETPHTLTTSVSTTTTGSEPKKDLLQQKYEITQSNGNQLKTTEKSNTNSSKTSTKPSDSTKK